MGPTTMGVIRRRKSRFKSALRHLAADKKAARKLWRQRLKEADRRTGWDCRVPPTFTERDIS